jgi:UDP-2,4-diacetamido-2,4,6-trideoxy-beta-L-altropyranose hydrolase
VVTVAENQKPIAEELNRLGLVRWIGNKDKVDQKLIYKNLFKLVDGDLDENWSSRCQQLVDGLGVNRVTAPLVVSKETPLKIRDARLSDESLLLMWANDPVTRKNAFSSSRIDPQAHRIWFYNRLRSIDVCKIYIVETQDDIPIGQVRFELKDQVWEIDYSITSIFRRCGLGKRVLSVALKRLKMELSIPQIVFGYVKLQNEFSCKVFESLGFNGRLKAAEMKEYMLEL